MCVLLGHWFYQGCQSCVVSLNGLRVRIANLLQWIWMFLNESNAKWDEAIFDIENEDFLATPLPNYAHTHERRNIYRDECIGKIMKICKKKFFFIIFWCTNIYSYLFNDCSILVWELSNELEIDTTRFNFEKKKHRLRLCLKTITKWFFKWKNYC